MQVVRNLIRINGEKSYFISVNQIKLKGVKVGPYPRGKKIQLKSVISLLPGYGFRAEPGSLSQLSL